MILINLFLNWKYGSADFKNIRKNILREKTLEIFTTSKSEVYFFMMCQVDKIHPKYKKNYTLRFFFFLI